MSKAIPFRRIGCRSNTENGILAGNRTVGFDIGADVDFEHEGYRSISGELLHLRAAAAIRAIIAKHQAAGAWITPAELGG